MSIFEQFPYTNFHDLNLDWILKHMKELVQSVQQITANLDGWDEEIKELQEWQKSIEDGNLTEPMETAIETWCTVHMPELLELAVKQVYFGLTDSGFFVAYIPDSWADIVFNTTGYDIVEELEPEYGHLVLSMEV